MQNSLKKGLLALSLVLSQTLTMTTPVKAEVVSNTWRTYNARFQDTCTGEFVNLTVNSHVVVRITGINPDGTVRQVIHQNDHVQGVGETSNKKYAGGLNIKREIVTTPGSCDGTMTFENHQRLMSQGKEGNLFIQVTQTFEQQIRIVSGMPACVFVLTSSDVNLECRG